MKYVVLLLVSFCFIVQSHGQSAVKSGLKSLSKEFQRAFRENGWRVDNSSPYGLSFYSIKDSVHWTRDGEQFSSLNPLIIENEHIQDSIRYRVRGLYDEATRLQIIDIMKDYHINHNVFVTPTVRGEFVGGMRKLQDSLVAYLNTTLVDFDKKGFEVAVYFAGVEPFSFMASTSRELDVEEAVSRFFMETSVKHLPGVWYGKPTYNCYIFRMKNAEAGFMIEDVYQYEFLFSHHAPDQIYFIEYLNGRKAPGAGDLSFLYDQKWTEEEFLASDDIRRILRESEDPLLLTVLKNFCREGSRMPFSAIYRIHVHER